jgi:hypothetical protein
MPFPRRTFVCAAGFAVTLAITSTGPPAFAAQPPVGLGTATSFAVLAGSTVTNTGPTTVVGDVGLSPGTAVVGFPPGLVTDGTIHAADAVALQAQNDLTTAYNDAAGRGPAVDETGTDLGNQTLQPGVYAASSSMALTGTLTLDAQGDPNAVFVFQAGSTLISASNSTVALIGAAQACNVFWQVGSSATFGTDTTFVGSVLALTDITMLTRASIQGRLLARNGQVALDTNTITRANCATVSPTTSASPTAPTSPSASFTASTYPSTPGGDDGGTTPIAGGPFDVTQPPEGGGFGANGPPVVPTGHPETGRAAATDGDSATLWLLGGVLSLGGATAAAVMGSRRRVEPRRA